MNNIPYVTEYEYATFALLSMLMVMYIIRRKLSTTTNSLFLVIMIYAFISSSLHIFTTKALGHAADYPLWFNYITNIGYLLAYNLTSIVYLVYSAAITKRNHIDKIDKIYAITILIADVALLVTTPFTRLVIYFDENMTYCQGPLFFVIPALSYSVLLYSAGLFITHRKQLKIEQKASIIIYISFTFSASLVQLLRPHQIIGNFAVALALIVMFISFENPADYIDRVTGCLNSEAFYITVENEIERKNCFSAAVFYIEGLNYFAELTEIKESGNICAKIANELKTGLQTDDLFYIGEWKFAVLIREKSKFSLEDTVKTIQAYFGVPITIRGSETMAVPVICTISYPEFAETAEDVRDAIEYTLKMMKKSGDLRTAASPEAIEAKKREMHILASIKQFIMNNSFEMYYQPLYDVESGTFKSAEALIRMKDSELGFISPEEFIPLAEANGLILQIGELTFRSVCEFLKSGRAKELGVEYIEVNLSVIQCVQEKLAAQLMGIMKEYGISPTAINFEITETAGLANYDILLKNMNKLISYGVTFSMDDYGTGFSTANYLIKLPTEIVKIDKSIIWPAMESDEAFIILKHTVEMLKSLNKKIVAEGVETAEMVKLLSDIGVDYLQGYYYSKPVPAADYIVFLEKNSKVNK